MSLSIWKKVEFFSPGLKPSRNQESWQHSGVVDGWAISFIEENFLLFHRYNINLGLSGLLDVPDFYWDRESLEPLYRRTKHYFSIAQRTQVYFIPQLQWWYLSVYQWQVMNEKLNYCFELMDLVHTRLAEKHSARLEWMIIILICIEVINKYIFRQIVSFYNVLVKQVAIELFHYWHDWYFTQSTQSHAIVKVKQ